MFGVGPSVNYGFGKGLQHRSRDPWTVKMNDSEGITSAATISHAESWTAWKWQWRLALWQVKYHIDDWLTSDAASPQLNSLNTWWSLLPQNHLQFFFFVILLQHSQFSPPARPKSPLERPPKPISRKCLHNSGDILHNHSCKTERQKKKTQWRNKCSGPLGMMRPQRASPGVLYYPLMFFRVRWHREN